MGACSSAEQLQGVDRAGQKYSRGSNDDRGVEISSRDSLFDVGTDDDLAPDETVALRRIQKSVRRTKALEKANAENHWRFFSQVDTQEEFETLRLAAFMDALVNLVPGAKELQEDAASSNKLLRASGLLLDDIILDDAADAYSRGLSAADAQRLGEIGKYKNVNESEKYVIKGPITPQTGKTIIELFRPPNVGRLDLRSLTKILKNVYKTLKATPNTNKITVPHNARVTVVGDIHGQLEDLLLILDESGDPSPSNLFLFNGDFVDRGEHGFEVVTIIFTLFAAYPGYVFFNRGNHEDPYVCVNYGFQQEVCEKYKHDEPAENRGQTFSLFAEVFKYIPLFSLINESVFVVHGGLFHSSGTLLSDLKDIDRTDYDAVPRNKYPECVQYLKHDDPVVRTEFLKQLQRDALWSDPRPVNGISPNTRGAGVLFGPDVTAKFMHNNNLSMIIRSHECCRHGTEFPYNSGHDLDRYYELEEASVGRKSVNPLAQECLPLNANDPLLMTLFSASNYLDGDNEGAYLVIKFDESVKQDPVGNASKVPSYANRIGSTGMFFTCHRFKTSAAHNLDEGGLRGKEITTKITAMDLLLRKKRALTLAFRNADVDNTEIVTRNEWAKIMREVTGLKILWLNTISLLVPVHALLEKGVLYMNFINSLAPSKHRENQKAIYKHTSHSSHGTGKKKDASGDDPSSSSQIMDLLYGNKKRMLETIFYYFDANSDGMINKEEFYNGCAKLNQIGVELAAKETAKNVVAGVADTVQVVPYVLKDIDDMLEVMDFCHTGYIDINEFFEAFRLATRNQGQGEGHVKSASVLLASATQ